MWDRAFVLLLFSFGSWWQWWTMMTIKKRKRKTAASLFFSYTTGFELVFLLLGYPDIGPDLLTTHYCQATFSFTVLSCVRYLFIRPTSVIQQAKGKACCGVLCLPFDWCPSFVLKWRRRSCDCVDGVTVTVMMTVKWHACEGSTLLFSFSCYSYSCSCSLIFFGQIQEPLSNKKLYQQIA